MGQGNISMMNRLLFGLALMAVGGIGKMVTDGGSVPSNLQVVERQDAGAPKNVKRNVVAYKTDDEALAASRKKAKATLQQFVEHRSKGLRGTYTIKFPLTQNGETEHIWLQVDRIGKDGVTGRLANEPVNGTEYKMGQKLTIAFNDVEDWMIRSQDGIRGAYSVRAMLKDMPAEQADKLKAMLIG